MDFDIRTAVLGLAVGNLVLGLTLQLFQFGAEHPQRIPFLSTGKLLQGIGWLLLYERGVLPDFLSFTVGNIVLIVGTAYDSWAMYRITQRPVSRTLQVTSTVSVIVLCILATPLSAAGRVAVSSFTVMVFFALGARVMLSDSSGNSLLRRYIGWSMWLMVAVVSVRGAWSALNPENFTLFSANTIQLVMFATLYYLMLTNGFGMLLLSKQITDRELRESEARFRLAFENANIGVCLVDTQGKLLRVNRQMSEIFGYSQAELESMNVNDITRSEFKDVSSAFMQRAKTGEVEHDDFEKEYTHKQGQSVWGQVSSSLVRNTEGDPLYFISHVIDITERKQAEEKLHQQNEYLSILHQITLDLLNRRNMDELLQTIVDRAVILLDAPFGELMLEENGVLAVKTFTKNQEFLKGEKVTRDEATISWQAFDTESPVILKDYATYPLRRDIYTGLHATADFPVVIRDRSIGVLSIGRSEPGYIFSDLQIENGMLFAQMVALVLDSAQLFSAAQYEIIERKRIETELRESRKFLADLIEYSATSVFAKDIDGRYELVNRRCEEITGILRENIIGRTDAEVFSEDVAARYRAIDLQVLESGKALEMEDVIDKPDGMQYLFTTKFPLRADGGGFRGVCGITTDITQRKKAEIQLANVNVQLRISVDEVMLLQEDLRQQTLHDPMTDLYNRRYMKDTFAREFSRAVREKHSLCVIMADMDNLKILNDTYGHAIGDKAIEMFALCIKSMNRAEDVACRYGGDEFTIIMSKTNTEDAGKRVADWRIFLENHLIPVNDETSIPVKFTAGVACFPAHGSSMEEVLKCADIALYQAKERGRNCTIVFDGSPLE